MLSNVSSHQEQPFRSLQIERNERELTAILVYTFGLPLIVNTKFMNTKYTIPIFMTALLLSAVAFAYPQNWNSGKLSERKLNSTHFAKNWQVKLKPGRYKWQVRTVSNKNRKGKINFYIMVDYAGDKVICARLPVKLKPGKTNHGILTIADFNYYKNKPSKGWGKAKVHIGRAGLNTNVNYRITLTRLDPFDVINQTPDPDVPPQPSDQVPVPLDQLNINLSDM